MQSSMFGNKESRACVRIKGWAHGAVLVTETINCMCVHNLTPTTVQTMKYSTAAQPGASAFSSPETAQRML